ncbi:hypothetical protein GCM10027568_33190 [Humibacter soli]
MVGVRKKAVHALSDAIDRVGQKVPGVHMVAPLMVSTWASVTLRLVRPPLAASHRGIAHPAPLR